MTATASQLEWCAFFDAWRRFEERGQLFLEPPCGVVTAGDFDAAIKSGVVHARVQMRTTPHPGVYLAFSPSPAWREYMRLRPTTCDGYPHDGQTDVVDLDWLDGDENDRTPTPRVFEVG